MVVSLVIGVICGIICAIIASAKGRSPVGWFFIGFLIGVIGLIIIACLPNVKEEEARRLNVEQENRRLREQIRQEQIKAEAFRSHAQRRLDVHDEKLGLDTRPDRLLDGSAPFAGLLEAGIPAPPVAVPGWYYAVNGRTCGPVASAAIMDMLRSKAIPKDTPVWIQGMLDWTTVERVPEFYALVNS